MTDNQVAYKALQDKYEHILISVAAIAQDFKELLENIHETEIIKKHGYSQEVFDIFRERANSELLSIAFFGAFSSGKSFLISGLNDKIDFFEYEGRDQYAPLLPASSRHTSSCPVAIEPLSNKKKKDRFWVWFEGAEDWEQKSPAIEAVIQAYVTDLPNAKTKRLSNKDRTRNVIKAKLGIASAKMKARLYDLPGVGAIGVNYEKTIHEFVEQADCLVYIAWAVRPLDEKDLDLLRVVYNHHQATGKPVFFVLTQIDRNWDYETASGNIGWEEVQQANNEFLETYFSTSDGKPNTVFIGDGFIPVSAAIEAKARHFTVQDPETSERFHAESQMQTLHIKFNEYLQNTSGPMHLAELASEIERLLMRLIQDIKSRIVSESTPLEQARTAIKGYKAQRSALIEGKYLLQTNLTKLGGAAIKRAFAGSDPDDLASRLKSGLQDKINEGEVLREQVVHDIETEKTDIVREWISRDNKALIPRWVGAWDSFMSQSDERLESLITDAKIAQMEAMADDELPEDADIAALEIAERLRTEYGDHRPETLQEAIDVMSTTWKTWSIVAGLGATGVISSIATAATAPALAVLGPVGWGILASAAIGAGFGKWRLKQKTIDRRKEMIDYLPEYSQLIVSSYQHQSEEFIQSRIGMLLEMLDSEIERLSDSINSLEQRLLTGEYVNRGQRLTNLERLMQQSSDADRKIKKLYVMASEIQPHVSLLLNNNDEK